MPNNCARNRRYVRVLFKFQKGKCAICREQMIIVTRNDKENHENPLRASLEHVEPQSEFPDKKSRFSNFMATHKNCNSRRLSKPPTADMLEFRDEVHTEIFKAGNPHIIRPQNSGEFDMSSIEYIVPFGISVEDFIAQELS